MASPVNRHGAKLDRCIFVRYAGICRFLGRLARIQCHDAGYCYRCSVSVRLCVSVCMLVTTTVCAETAKPIQMTFGVSTRVYQSKLNVYVKGRIPPKKGAIWGSFVLYVSLFIYFVLFGAYT